MVSTFSCRVYCSKLSLTEVQTSYINFPIGPRASAVTCTQPIAKHFLTTAQYTAHLSQMLPSIMSSISFADRDLMQLAGVTRVKSDSETAIL